MALKTNKMTSKRGSRYALEDKRHDKDKHFHYHGRDGYKYYLAHLSHCLSAGKAGKVHGPANVQRHRRIEVPQLEGGLDDLLRPRDAIKHDNGHDGPELTRQRQLNCLPCRAGTVAHPLAPRNPAYSHARLIPLSN